MANNYLLREQDLVNNPTPRVPVCLCLDTSSSMGAVEGGDFVSTGKTVYEDGKTWTIVTGGTSRIDELKKGIELFYESIREDEIAVFAAEICIVTFDSKATCVMDFANIDRQDNMPEIKASGNTYMGEGVNLALDLLEQRKKEYRKKGVDYYQPWLVVMTDGEPNGNKDELSRAIQRTSDMVNAGKLSVFAVGVGKEADMDVLNRLSPKRAALRLKGLKFKEFFEWLSKSVSKVSQSMPGEKTVVVEKEDIKPWGEL